MSKLTYACFVQLLGAKPGEIMIIINDLRVEAVEQKSNLNRDRQPLVIVRHSEARICCVIRHKVWRPKHTHRSQVPL